MKKISTLLMGMFIALSAVAAPANLDAKFEKKEAAKQLFGAKKEVNVQKAGLKKAAQVKADAAVTFGVDIDSLTTVSARVDITPSNLNVLYYYTIAEKAQVDTMADATIAESIKSNFDYYIMMYYYYYGVEYTYADFLLQGLDGYNFKELTPATEYTVLVMQLDGESCDLIGDVTRYNFSTLEIVPTGDTIQVVVNNLKWIDKYFAEEGWWQMAGYSADSTYYVSMSNTENASQIEGTYDYVLDMDPDYTVLYIGEEAISFVSGEVVVSANGDGTYHIDANLMDVNGDVYHLVLDSKLATPSTNVITMTYNVQTRSINITTTNADPYFFYVESQDEYDEYFDDLSQASINEESDQWISTLNYYGYLANYTYSGNEVIDLVDFFGSYAATDNYIALAAPVEDGERNGEAVYLQFFFDYPEAIENTDATVTAIKRIENGQFIIEKNGVRYNAVGTMVK